MTGRNRIMIYGPKEDGSYVVEFRTADGDVLAISIPKNEAAVIRYFQEGMPHGVFVSDADPSGGMDRRECLQCRDDLIRPCGGVGESDTAGTANAR